MVNADALQWLEESKEYFDFIVIDFPDPSNFALGKLYTAAFYRLIEKRLSANGLMRGAVRPRRSMPGKPSGAW